MIKRVSTSSIKLWIMYQENGSVVTGLTDLKVEAFYSGGSSVLSETSLTEEGSTGIYSYTWNLSGVAKDSLVLIHYLKGSDVLDIEEFIFDIIEDQDGVML